MARHVDVFNGDADGLCALRQLRLEEERGGELVTGTKRDTRLLARVHAGRGDIVTVLDVSLDQNREPLERLLAAGVSVRYFDHHYAGEIPASPHLEAHIETGPEFCTSLLVDRYLGGRRRLWAIAACFGDGLVAAGRQLALQASIDGPAVAALQELGECLNYNAYGEREQDLCFPPADLYAILERYADPREFVARDPAFGRLCERRDGDLQRGLACEPAVVSAARVAYVLPDTDWSRRVGGILANRIAERDPQRACAVLYPASAGGFVVSVRAPRESGRGASALCRQFSTGGGREGAAGINRLPAEALPAFLGKFAEAFPDPR